MKIYVIMQKATEYNDEYDQVQEEGAKIYKAYCHKPTQEQIDAAKWDAVQGKSAEEGEWPSDMAYVEEIDVEESQIIQPKEVALPKNGKHGHTYEEARAISKKAREDASQLAKHAIEILVQSVFEKYPDLISFSWTQYTPYFNDGDECTFSVNSDYPTVKLKGFESEDEDSENDVSGVLYFRSGNSDKVYVVDNDYDEKKVKFSYGKRGGSMVSGVKIESEDWATRKNVEEAILKEKLSEGYGSPVSDIKQLLSSIDEEDMKHTFGDHVEVTATREGITTEEYSHD